MPLGNGCFIVDLPDDLSLADLTTKCLDYNTHSIARTSAILTITKDHETIWIKTPPMPKDMLFCSIGTGRGKLLILEVPFATRSEHIEGAVRMLFPEFVRGESLCDIVEVEGKGGAILVDVPDKQVALRFNKKLRLGKFVFEIADGSIVRWKKVMEVFKKTSERLNPPPSPPSPRKLMGTPTTSKRKRAREGASDLLANCNDSQSETSLRLLQSFQEVKLTGERARRRLSTTQPTSASDHTGSLSPKTPPPNASTSARPARTILSTSMTPILEVEPSSATPAALESNEHKQTSSTPRVSVTAVEPEDGEEEISDTDSRQEADAYSSRKRQPKGAGKTKTIKKPSKPKNPSKGKQMKVVSFFPTENRS